MYRLVYCSYALPLGPSIHKLVCVSSALGDARMVSRCEGILGLLGKVARPHRICDFRR